MEQNVLLNKKEKGFTIIEALVSLTILAIILIGLLAGILKSYEIVVRNQIRDEAVKTAQEILEDLRNRDFDNLPNSLSPITRQIRNSSITFTPTINITDVVQGDVKKVSITINWNYKGKTYSYTTETLIRRE
jgi:type II secretory pathway pseudopilin PulG